MRLRLFIFRSLSTALEGPPETPQWWSGVGKCHGAVRLYRAVSRVGLVGTAGGGRGGRVPPRRL